VTAAAIAASRADPAPAASARPAPALRLIPFAGLALFVGVRWGAIVDPAATGRGWLSAAIGLALAGALLLAARVPRRDLRLPAAVLATALALATALLAAGVPARDLKPRHWGSLVDGVGSGLSSLPGIATPYSGADRWTHIVILLGASTGLVLAAALAFWPRRAPAGTGWPLVALVALIGLAAVPATVLEGDSPVVQGVVLFLLAAAFLATERLAAADVPVAVPVVGSLAALAVVLAPALNGHRPWLDYQAAANALAPTGERFDWSQGYGPLHWPRTTHEVLRIKATHPAYWKAENLDIFDGLRWRAAPATSNVGIHELAPGAQAHPDWVQKIGITVRGLHSRQMITAGDASSVSGSTEPVAASPASTGTFVAKRTLGAGDYYNATVYTPRPTTADLEGAGTNYPQDLNASRMLVLQSGGLDAQVVFPAFDSTVPTPYAVGRTGDATSIVERSDYGRTYDLALRLRAQTTTPYDYVRAVESYLSHGFTYTESPPRRPVPIEAFLWRDRRGYCQQFAGAMALLLRMGGVPARVAVGFAPGTYDKQLEAWRVRDVEAHAWVEAWFPGIGWVTFDPTPAAAPALGQASTNREPVAGGGRLSGLNFTGRLSRDPLSSAGGSAAAAGSGGKSAKHHGGGILPWLAGGGGLAAFSLLGTALLLRRRDRSVRGPHDAWLSELERALRRAGRAPRPGTTLRQIEERLAGTSDAAAYVAAVRAQRYGAAADPPTHRQRRGLRRELRRGLGPVGALRAWWALPPKPLS
jgi:transglutaminase-like putative cysteine protease